MANRRFGVQNNKTVDKLRYLSPIFHTDPDDLNFSEYAEANTYGYSSYVEEHNFMHVQVPHFRAGGTEDGGFTDGTDLPNFSILTEAQAYPFTYLKVPLPDVGVIGNTGIGTSNNLIDSQATALQFHGLYIHAQAYFYESPTEYSMQGSGDNDQKHALAVTFEHFGTVTCRHTFNTYKTNANFQPSENIRDDGSFESNLRFNSYLNVLSYHNREGNLSGQFEGTQDVVYSDLLSTPIDTAVWINNTAIYYNATENQFEARLSPNYLVNYRNQSFWGDTTPRGYTIIVKGTYLLM